MAGARKFHLFAGVDGGEDVGEVLLRVLGADLHGFSVVERGCGVNPEDRAGSFYCLPDRLQSIIPNLWIERHQGNVLGQSLGYEQAVARIVMNLR